MAISKEFLQLFREFVTKYKINGQPSRFAYKNETNYEKICERLDGILVIIIAKPEIYSDKTIIASLNHAVNLYNEINPVFCSCWRECYKKYDTAIRSCGTIDQNDKLDIIVSPDTGTIGITKELTNGLISLSQTVTLTAQIHQIETDQLNRTIEELNAKIKEQSLEIVKLKQQLQDQTRLISLEPQFEIVKSQVVDLFHFISSVHESIKNTSEIQVSNVVATPPSPTDSVSITPTPAPPITTSSTTETESYSPREELGNGTNEPFSLPPTPTTRPKQLETHRPPTSSSSEVVQTSPKVELKTPASPLIIPRQELEALTPPISNPPNAVETNPQVESRSAPPPVASSKPTRFFTGNSNISFAESIIAARDKINQKRLGNQAAQTEGTQTQDDLTEDPKKKNSSAHLSTKHSGLN